MEVTERLPSSTIGLQVGQALLQSGIPLIVPLLRGTISVTHVADISSCCRAFNTCPIDQVRVVIIGQDPYHNTGQAMGLSFSVPPGKAVPSSLQNIYKELLEDCGCTVPKHGDLEKVRLAALLICC